MMNSNNDIWFYKKVVGELERSNKLEKEKLDLLADADISRKLSALTEATKGNKKDD